MTKYEILCLVVSALSLLSPFAVIIFQVIFTSRLEKRKAKDLEDNIERKALQALLRDRLLKDGLYFTSQGWIDVASKDSYANMYEQYHRLGKNGVMDTLYNDVMQLPNVPSGVAVIR